VHWVLILPDGSRSLIPAEWTDHGSSASSCREHAAAHLASVDELLQLRTIVDALLRRATASPRDVAQLAARDAEGE
jgi:hypothetical protein